MNSKYPTAKQEELAYFYILLLAIASGIYQTALLVRHGVNLTFRIEYFSIAMFLSIPFALFVNIIIVIVTGGKIREKFFIKSPSTHIEASFDEEINSWTTRCKERMSRLGFHIIELKPTQWRISKPATGGTHGFLAHRFQGELNVVEKGKTFVVNLDLTLQDILILETGEYNDLRQLGKYMLCQSDRHQPETGGVPISLPLTLVCAIYLALVAHILAYLSIFDILPKVPFVEMFQGGLGMSLWMIWMIKSKSNQLIGLRLAIMNSIVCLTPFIAKGIDHLLTRN